MRVFERALACGAIVASTAGGALAAASTAATYITYWGDLHGHTMDSPVSLNTSIIDGYIRYARDTRGLNFVALTEKDFDLSDSEWSDCKARAAAFTTTSFVAFSAYEWGDDGYGDFGHRPVYFPSDSGSLLRSDAGATDHVSELLEALGPTGAFTSVAHPDLSNYLADWDYFDGAVDRVAEIYSRHGHYETGDQGLQQALAQGYRFGFVAVSDTRTATPGSHGLTAVLATSLTKSSLHAAIKARRTYATTGPKILLDVTADGHAMGEEYTSSTGPMFTVSCTPVGSLESIEILKNNVVVYVYQPGSALLAESASWRMPPASDAVATAAWTAPDYDDGAWMESGVQELTAGRSAGPMRLRRRFVVERVPSRPLLRAQLEGEYRIVLNGQLVVDTRTLQAVPETAPHDCNAPDGHDLPGSRERFRALGFYDLESLGLRLQPGENVLAVEYEPGSTAAAFDVGIEATTAAAPVSFGWADNSFTGAAFYYVRVTQADGHQAWGSPIWVDRTVPDTVNPQAPIKLRANKDGQDVYLDWPKVTKDEAGNLEKMGFYRIFRGTSYDFVPDRTGLSNQIGTTSSSSYRDRNALQNSTDYYYRVTSVDAAGNQSSGHSNLAFKVHHPLTFHTATSNLFWLSLPYAAIYNTADRLARDLNRAGSGPCTKLVHWNVVTQRPESYVYLGGRWAGTNFPIVPGEAVAITIDRDLDVVLVGAHDEGKTVRLTSNPGGPSLNWIGIPRHAPHQFAYQVTQDINNGYFPGPVTRITRLHPDLQTYQSYSWNGSTWSGTNFVLVPGEAYGVEVQTTSDWLPDTVP